MDQNTRTWAMVLHLSVFAGYIVPLAGLVVPIVVWQLKKEEMPALDDHGKMVVNFLISMLIYSVISFVLVFAFIGIPLLFALSIIGIVFPIIGGIKANGGELWQYPLILKLVK